MEKLSREEKLSAGGKMGGAKFFNISTSILGTISLINFLFDLLGRYAVKEQPECQGVNRGGGYYPYEEHMSPLFSKAELLNLKKQEQNRIIIFPEDSKTSK